MKHAGPAALDDLEPLLAKLRLIPDLKEKSRGVFYLSGSAFLHFHEDGDEFFADVRSTNDFERLPASSSVHQMALVRKVNAVLKNLPRPCPMRNSAKKHY